MCFAAGIATAKGAIEGAVLGAAERMVMNRIAGRPALEGVGRTAAEGAVVGGITAGAGSLVRMARAFRRATDATDNVTAHVANRAEAEAVGETFVGPNTVPMLDRRSGHVVGKRNPESGARYRPEAGQDHVNVQNAQGGNAHLKFPNQ